MLFSTFLLLLVASITSCVATPVLSARIIPASITPTASVAVTQPSTKPGKIISAAMDDQWGAIPQSGTVEMFNIGIPGADGIVLPVQCNITWDAGTMAGAPTIQNISVIAMVYAGS